MLYAGRCTLTVAVSRGRRDFRLIQRGCGEKAGLAARGTSRCRSEKWGLEEVKKSGTVTSGDVEGAYNNNAFRRG